MTAQKIVPHREITQGIPEAFIIEEICKKIPSKEKNIQEIFLPSLEESYFEEKNNLDKDKTDSVGVVIIINL